MSRHDAPLLKPRPFSPRISAFAKSSGGCKSLGCLLPVALVVAATVASVRFAKSQTGSPATPPSEIFQWFVLAVLISWAFILIANYLLSDWLARRAEARATAEQLRKRSDWFKAQGKFLWQSVEEAEKSLEMANREYADRAYGPFWDGIEKAAGHLDRCQQGFLTLSAEIKIYGDSLLDREHTFPAWDDGIEKLPDPSHLLSVLQQLTRAGQTNFEFANIHEHRRGQKILVAGFQNLSEGIRHLETTMVRSFDDLKQTISADLKAIQAGQTRAERILLTFVPVGRRLLR